MSRIAKPIVPQASRRAHLVGIGGSGMRALANVLSGSGWHVTGSDSSSLECRPGWHTGHAAKNVPADAQVLVYSHAIPGDNCERRRATELGIESINYAQMLGRIMQRGRGLAVAGTHGKSSTTAMVAEILGEAGFDPTVVLGAQPLSGRPSGRAGQGEWILAEACEYRRSFHELRPEITAILGIEPDHFDCYHSSDVLFAAYQKLAHQTSRTGCLIVNHDCPEARRLALREECRVETFGLGAEADWHADELHEEHGIYRFRLCYQKLELGDVRLRVPGRHQVSNALAAAAMAAAANAPTGAILTGLERYAGLHRRLERAGSLAGVTWIDDYAHHPTEVAASLTTLREMAPDARLWCVFQPHQASRVSVLADSFAEALTTADEVAIAEVFQVRETISTRLPVSAANLADRLRKLGGSVMDVHRADEIESRLARAIRLGQLTARDIIITMGAGDVGRIGTGLASQFSNQRMAG